VSIAYLETTRRMFLPTLPDDETARRAQLLLVILLILLGSCSVIIGTAFFVPTFAALIPLLMGVVLTLLALLVVLRRGFVTGAAIGLLVLLIAAVIVSGTIPALAAVPGGSTALSLTHGVIVVLAAFLLAWWSSLPTALAIMVSQDVVAVSMAQSQPIEGISMLTLLTLSAVAALFARSLDGALSQARRQEERAQAEAARVSQLKADVEGTLNETRKLLDQERYLRDTINKLAVPVQDLGNGVLFAPLVGHIDAERGQQMTDTILQQVYTLRAHTLVLDVQGVSTIDSGVAQSIERLIQAIQLLGAQVMLTGMSAEMAATITRLGISFNRVALYSSVGAALDAVAGQRDAPQVALRRA
jgi:rsbT co-antagonist protein RsbR